MKFRFKRNTCCIVSVYFLHSEYILSSSSITAPTPCSRINFSSIARALFVRTILSSSTSMASSYSTRVARSAALYARRAWSISRSSSLERPASRAKLLGVNDKGELLLKLSFVLIQSLSESILFHIWFFKQLFSSLILRRASISVSRYAVS